MPHGARCVVAVAKVFSNTVSVINGRTSTVTVTITVGSDPAGVAADPKLHTGYGDGTVSVLGPCPR